MALLLFRETLVAAWLFSAKGVDVHTEYPHLCTTLTLAAGEKFRHE